MRATLTRGVSALVLAVAALIGGCSASGQTMRSPAPSSPTASSPAPSSPAPSSVASGHAAAFSAAVAQIQAYLDVWVKDGPSAATIPPAGAVLLSGSVTSYREWSWTSADDFTLDVTMNLHFRGDPTKWNWFEGANDRFFRFTRPDAGSAYRMYVATGP
jgi:hypothetical protein